MILKKFKKTTGILIRETKFKEKSKYLTFYTDSKGLVTLAAFPAKSSFLPVFALPSKYSISYYTTPRGNNYLREIDCIDNYKGIHSNFNKLSISWHILSPLRKLISPGGEDRFIYNLTNRALSAISESKGKKIDLLILSSFYLMLIMHFGVGFSVNLCVKCRNKNDLYSLSPKTGGILCKKCSVGQSDIMKVNVKILKEIKNKKAEEFFNISTSFKVLTILIKSMEIYLFSNFSTEPPEIDL